MLFLNKASERTAHDRSTCGKPVISDYDNNDDDDDSAVVAVYFWQVSVTTLTVLPISSSI